MKLRVIFGHREERYDGEHSPEAIECWDEGSIEENESGWAETVAKAKARTEFAAIAVLTFAVSTDNVMAALYPKDEIKAHQTDAENVR